MSDHLESNDVTHLGDVTGRRAGNFLMTFLGNTFTNFNTIYATIIIIWLSITISAVCLPYLPIDETRYVSVAWDMRLHHSQWVPLMNGAPYSDKPPMLFWLMELGWYVFGVNDVWPRLISPLASLLAIILLYKIARGLGYPKHIAQLSQLILLSLPVWSLYSSLIMFDVLLSAFVLGAIEPLTRPGAFTCRRALMSGCWLGMAMLTKGPVALVTFVPVLITAGIWRRVPLGRKGCLWGSVSVMIGLAILMSWALSAAWLGGHEFAESLLWGQTVNRMHGAGAAHARPFWWYCLWLPVFSAPWVLWADQWIKWHREVWRSLLFWWLCIPFVVFSLISGKQIHYLMPLMPALALFIANQVEKMNLNRGCRAVFQSEHHLWLPARASLEPVSTCRLALVFLLLAIAGVLLWNGFFPNIHATGVPVHLSAVLVLLASGCVVWAGNMASMSVRICAIAVVLNISLILCGQMVIANAGDRYDVSSLSHAISELQQRGVPVAYADGDYQATFQFIGRLQQSLVTLDGTPTSIHLFSTQYPQGWVVGDLRDFPPHILASPDARRFLFKGRTLVLAPVIEVVSGSFQK